MNVRVFDPEELPLVLGALREIPPAPTPVRDDLLRAIALLHGRTIDAATLPRIAPAHLVAAVGEPLRRKRLVELATVVAMADGEVTPAAAAAVSALAAALGVDRRTTRTLARIAARRGRLVRLDIRRRVFARFVGGAFREGGFREARKVLGAMLGLSEDADTARRHRALEHLPAGSFGRAYWEHCAHRGFPFPGERGAMPERAIFHDLGHVLAGYDTDPAGEIQQAAFQAGYVRKDGFIFLLFGIAQFHLGLKLTPIAEPEVGYFEVGRVMTALARGGACNTDLSDRWDYWSLFPRPLDEVRRLLGIPPLASRLFDAAEADP